MLPRARAWRTMHAATAFAYRTPPSSCTRKLQPVQQRLVLGRSLGEKLVGARAFLQKRHVHSTLGGLCAFATEPASLTAALLASAAFVAAAAFSAALARHVPPSSVNVAGFSATGLSSPSTLTPTRPEPSGFKPDTVPERPLSSDLPTSE
eukprot:scaffold125129_cov69-Phaeocystis_antarctica.AAC.2